MPPIKKNIMEESLFTPGSYAWFHFQLKGKNLLTPDGVRTKLEIYCDNRKNVCFMERIIKGKEKSCIPVDKPGWRDGVLV